MPEAEVWNLADRLIERCRHSNLVHFRYGLACPNSCSPELIRKVRALATQNGVGIHIHIAETRFEWDNMQRLYGKTPTRHLYDLGLLGPDVLAVHCIDLTDGDLDILQRNKVNIAHTPMTNSLGGNGVARVPEMLQRGMNVTLGHDCFFTLDTMEYIRYAYLVHKAHNANPMLLPPFQALDMALGNAARALGWGGKIGSLAAGKRADIVIVKPDSPTPLIPASAMSFFTMTLLGKDVETVFVDGERIDSVADAAQLAPGVAAVARTYEMALAADLAPVMQASVPGFEAPVNRMIALAHGTADLLNRLEAVRLVCQETGCAQRYLGGDALNALFDGTYRTDAAHGSDYHARLKAYLEHVYGNDLTLGVAMTDAKGDRSLRPSRQPNPDSYVHIVGRSPRGIVISGTKAIVVRAGRSTINHIVDNNTDIRQLAENRDITKIDKMRAVLTYYAVNINRPPLIDITEEKAVFHNPGCTLCKAVRSGKPYCTYVCGVFEGMARYIVGLERARCEEVACKAVGDDECRYEIVFDAPE